MGRVEGKEEGECEHELGPWTWTNDGGEGGGDRTTRNNIKRKSGIST